MLYFRKPIEKIFMPDFSHLHVHSQFSLLDGAAKIEDLMKKAKANNMKAVALTDHGNMFGAFKFVAEANKYGVKPIVGCEFYVVEDRHKKQFTKEDKDKRYHQLLLAKNKKGYENLSKLCSLGYIDGLYSKWPRIDKELLLEYHEGIIATTCCIGAEIPQAILFKGEEEAEKIFKWYLDIFGEDYYIELQRHGLENIDGTGISQEDINQTLLKWDERYGVKVIATNDSHYLEEDDSAAHDILLCVNTGELRSTPIGQGSGYRFGFPNNQFFFKTKEQMEEMFGDVPFALDNTIEIVDKVEELKLARDILLPAFKLPPPFTDEWEYLKYLSFEGAKRRYGEVTATIEERLNFELKVIKDMGFSGYFLIVQDFIAAGRNLGVAVGPGRGSAAGSAIAYCIGITNIDPIKYDLLFERFLNPERVSMPDIDIDFDDQGRQKVIDYVVDKYGKNQVAQIITFGSMAAKSSIRDVARVLDLPLQQADRLAKLIPDGPGISLDKAYADTPELKEILNSGSDEGAVLTLAKDLEGSVRNTGIHAAGIIIAPDDITKYIPVSTSKDSDLLVTQFDGKYIESAGMLKMDFLGLKTLTIIKSAIEVIKLRHGIEIDPDEIPLDDPKTFELYQRGDTVGTFQFESDGMRLYLRDLKPTNIEDLIAMNALYRPGPMDFIPDFIACKQGKKEVVYPHEMLEGILKNTFGIMVYQEQIMQTAQIMGGFSLGKADVLRRAMGKKKLDEMQQMKAEFVAGAAEKDISEEKASEVFKVMEKFAQYGFNRSHSAAYSVVAYQTGYLKANYPAEYMAAVLNHNMNDIKKITFFMNECKRMGVAVLGPDVNESMVDFSVNDNGEIRFGMGAIKGIGSAVTKDIVEERLENGPYTSVFDLVKRCNLRGLNRRTIESLAMAGGFDSFEGIHRAQFLHSSGDDDTTGAEKIIRFGQAFQANLDASQASLFGEDSEAQVREPELPKCDTWSLIEQLNYEKEVIGIYLSGHPLDDHKTEIEYFTNTTLDQLEDLAALKGKEIKIGGIITARAERVTKKGAPFGTFRLEDYSGGFEFFLFSKDYMTFKQYIETGYLLYIKGKVTPKFYDESQLEFKINSMELLSDIKDKYMKSITVMLTLDRINPDMLNVIRDVTEKHAGEVPLKMIIKDEEEEGHVVNLHSRKYRVSGDQELLNLLT